MQGIARSSDSGCRDERFPPGFESEGPTLMSLTDGRLFRICGWIGRTRQHERRRLRPSLDDRLESRAVPAIVGLTGKASPEIIQPINPMNQPRGVVVDPFRSVTLAGYVYEDGGATPV